jgi:CheY-like chemotaxis protein
VGAHLLVVDDSAMNRDLVERALHLEGATATLAADGQQAVQLLQTRPERFDAVLMDVQMPVMDGLAATRMIRGQLGMLDLPIIAFTAGVRDDQQAAARAAGADDVLAKPMDLEQMAVAAVEVDPAPSGCLPAPGAAEPEIVEAFPDIAGIDSERASQRLSRDRDMFIGLLELFVHDNTDAARPRPARHWPRGTGKPPPGACTPCASNAGFLCALDLMAAARVLEQAIDQGEVDLDERLDTLEKGIADLVTASAPWR